VPERNAARRIVLGLLALTAVAVAVGALVAIGHWLPTRGILATRILAVAYLVCDVAIGSSLVILLVVRGRRAPEWVEQRLPFGGRWLWYVLLGLTVLCYAGLAPTFLFLFIRMQK
jgi:hypothetical protein